MRSPRRLLTVLLLCVLGLLALPAAGHAELRVRKDVKDMTAQEKKDFVDAVRLMKKTPSPFGKRGISLYDILVYYHRRASYPIGKSGAHAGPAFLPWHRALLLYFENALENISGKPITIPYWNWSDPASTRAVFAPDFMGGTGDPKHGHAVTDGPFRRGQWKLKVFDLGQAKNPLEPDIDVTNSRASYIQRSFGSLDGFKQLPTAADDAAILGVSRYDAKPYSDRTKVSRSFRCAIEGWSQLEGHENGGHNAVHMWVAGGWERGGQTEIGSLGDATSPNDPVFWVLHANVDRLWDQWQQTNGLQYEPTRGALRGHNLRDAFSQFGELELENNRPVDVLDELALGVKYAPPGG